jgi:2-oxoglutarate dehydrogenase complex dehydrogenase (E1) component-like enzyme
MISGLRTRNFQPKLATIQQQANSQMKIFSVIRRLLVPRSAPCDIEWETAALDRYPKATDVCWVQEEPANQGAWPFYGLSLPELMPGRLGALRRISRRAMAAPSAGSAKVHEVEQQELIAAALDA